MTKTDEPPRWFWLVVMGWAIYVLIAFTYVMWR